LYVTGNDPLILYFDALILLFANSGDREERSEWQYDDEIYG
jgi:hypothetical protein